MYANRRWLILGATLVGLGVVGCGGDRPTLGRVAGRVTLDGKALPEARITFSPVEVERGRESVGVTDTDGNYEVIYIRDIKGASVGQHVVRISRYEHDREMVPARYNSRSTLTRDVTSGSQQIDFELLSD